MFYRKCIEVGVVCIWMCPDMGGVCIKFEVLEIQGGRVMKKKILINM